MRDKLPNTRSVGNRLFAFLLLAFCLVGCHSNQPKASSRLAAVIIKNSSMSQVEDVTRAVFSDNEYLGLRPREGQFIFEKKGTGMNTLAYGDWSTKGVWVRVKVYLRELSPTEILVECDAYMVGEHGDAHFEEEHKLTRMHHGTYQKLLEEIQKRLK